MIPLAERAIETGDPAELAGFLSTAVRDEVMVRFAELMAMKTHAADDLAAARRYVTAMLGLQVWAHKMHGAVHAAAHEGGDHVHA